MITDIFYHLCLLTTFWRIEDNRYSIVTLGRQFLFLFFVFFSAFISAGSKKYDGHCVFDLSKVFGKLVDVYSLYFNVSLVTFCVNQEECFILFINYTVPDKGEDIQLIFILFCCILSYCFEVLQALIDFIVYVLDLIFYLSILKCINIIWTHS